MSIPNGPKEAIREDMVLRLDRDDRIEWGVRLLRLALGPDCFIASVLALTFPANEGRLDAWRFSRAFHLDITAEGGSKFRGRAGVTSDRALM